MNVIGDLAEPAIDPHFEVLITLHYDDDSDHWFGTTFVGANYYRADWYINPSLELADLYLSGEHNGQAFGATYENLALNWGIPWVYVVTDWDSVNPPGSTFTASFTF